jgi:hypothetical protein
MDPRYSQNHWVHGLLGFWQRHSAQKVLVRHNEAKREREMWTTKWNKRKEALAELITPRNTSIQIDTKQFINQ